MKAAQLVEYRKPLEIREVEIPEPTGQQVLVRIAGAGICHSDLHLIEGMFPLPFLPLTLGHENTGYVEKAGEDAIGFDVGDPVAVYGAWTGKSDRFGWKGEGNLSQVKDWVGVGHHGGYAEFLLVPSYRYLLHLGRMDPVKSTPLVDAGLTSYRAVKKLVPNVYPGSNVALIGIGGQGQFGVQYSKLVLPQVNTIAVDIDDGKLGTAKSLGADETMNSTHDDVLGTVWELTHGEGCQGVIDFVGTTETMNLAYSLLGRQGKLVIVGLNGGKLEIVPDMIVNEAEVTTSNWGTMLELSEVIAIASSGKLRIELEEMKLDKVNYALERLKKGAAGGRIILTP